MKILLIEDDAKTSDYVSKGFFEAGHVCDVFADGRDSLFQAQREAYDVIVVDRMLPGLDGLAIVPLVARRQGRHAGAVSDLESAAWTIAVEGLGSGAATTN